MINTKPKDEAAGLRELLFASLRGILIAVAATLLLSLILTAVALMTKDPKGLIGIFAYAVLIIASLLGGVTASKTDTEQRLGASLVSGGGYVLVMWLFSLFLRSDTSESASPLWTVIVYIGCIALSLVGSVVARPKRTRIKEGKNSVTARLRRQLGKRT
ncbi:MAG: TIGR04086 family membrane protein [Clostridia bacterium]|nr:TIGR04086 family membrane protein [Clostridia bacterium]